MRRATLLIVSVLLAVPAGAQAKGGLEFDQYPEEVAVGAPIDFTVMTFHQVSAGDGLEERPTEGVRPLVTFRSESGRVVRVRASRTDLNGIAYGSVAFPDKGPWTTEIKAPGFEMGQELSQPIDVGTGLIEHVPPVSAERPPAAAGRATDTSGGFPWVWTLAGMAALSAALLGVARRRRGRWGAA